MKAVIGSVCSVEVSCQMQLESMILIMVKINQASIYIYEMSTQVIFLNYLICSEILLTNAWCQVASLICILMTWYEVNKNQLWKGKSFDLAFDSVTCVYCDLWRYKSSFDCFFSLLPRVKMLAGCVFSAQCSPDQSREYYK